MGSRPKRGGYFWNQEIAQGLQANAQARRILDRLIEDPPTSQARLFQLLAALSQHLAIQLEAFTELERIDKAGVRAPAKGKEEA